MSSHIDVSVMLRTHVNRVYSDLVTRPTGMAVRHGIERELASLHDGSIACLDFSRVGMIDLSCADEVVAKLVLLLASHDPPRGGYVVVRGLTEHHLESIEAVLEHHGLALVVEFDDAAPCLVGAVSEDERRVWAVVRERGRADAAELAASLGLDEDAAARLLDLLSRRRLLMRASGSYVAVGAHLA